MNQKHPEVTDETTTTKNDDGVKVVTLANTQKGTRLRDVKNVKLHGAR